MNFDVLDFLWYLIKLLAFASLALILMQIIVISITSILDSFKKRKMQENLDKALLDALKSGNVNVDVIEKEPKKTTKKKNSWHIRKYMI